MPHSRPTLGPDEERAAAEVVASERLVNGPRRAAFEEALARRLGRAGALAVTSGSAALHLALRALGVGEDDRVALPSYGCVSLLQAVRRCGADPLLVDCDPDGFGMDPDDLARRLDRRTRAVLLVHTFGDPLDPAPVLRLGLPVVEDVATALGAVRGGRPCGAEGAVAVGSFHATKMVTTGAGGAVATDDAALLAALRETVDYDGADDPDVRYNEALPEIGAAIGLVQLGRLDELLARRRRLARLYHRALDGAALLRPAPEEPGREPAWHRYVVRVPGGAETVRRRLDSAGIDSPPPVQRPLHHLLGLDGFPGSEAAFREALSLPLYPALPDEVPALVAAEVARCLPNP